MNILLSFRYVFLVCTKSTYRSSSHHLFTLGFSYSFPRLVNDTLCDFRFSENPVCKSCYDFSPQPSQLVADTVGWWAQVESNHRPHAYQACALTFWAMSPYFVSTTKINPWSQSNSYEPRFRFFNRWWRWRESNPWPPACRAGALPAELHPHNGIIFNSPWKSNNNWMLRIVSTSSVCFFVSYERSYFNLSCSP